MTVKRVVLESARGRPATQHVQTFTLACDPPRGTLPFAARLCADIAAHPLALLTPPAARGTCIGPPALEPGWTGSVVSNVEVTTVAGGTTDRFDLGHEPAECRWPTGLSASLYAAAAARDAKALRAREAKLGCLEDPVLLIEPTPWPLVHRCMGWPVSDASTNATTLLLARYPWLASKLRQTLTELFGGTHPSLVRLVEYDRRTDQRIVAILEFPGIVDCLTCGDDPTALATTTGRVVRVSYDRETRVGLVTRFCDTITACR